MMRALRQASAPTRLALLVLVTCAASPLAVTIWASWRVATSPSERHALTFDVVERELDSLFVYSRANEPVRLAAGVDSLTADSIIATGSPLGVPSLRKAGFLHDQIADFNTHERWASRAAATRAQRDSFAGLNPSVFRVSRRLDGSRALVRSTSTSGLRVASPFELGSSLTVTARNSRSTMSLVGLQRTIPLDTSSEQPVRDGAANRTCRFERQSIAGVADARILVYCVSALGRARQELPQATLIVEAERVALVPGYGDTRVDDRRLSRRDTAWLSPGSMVMLAPLEPMLLSRTRTNVISTTQWSNGRRRLVSSDGALLPFPLRLQPRNAAPAAAGERVLPLSIDAELSRTLRDRLAAFIRRRDIPIDFASVVVAEARTGRVLALTEQRASGVGERIRSFEATPMGSAVKPILGAAILSERPDLTRLTVPSRAGRVTELFGRRVDFDSPQNCRVVPADVDLEQFLRCSNNRFSVALLFASLSAPGEPVRIPTGAGGRVDADRLTQGAAATGLLHLFGVAADREVSRALGGQAEFWQSARTLDGDSVLAPLALQPERSHPSLVLPDSAGTTTALLAQYALGAWENRWTILDLAQAFARVLTDNAVQLNFAAPQVSPSEVNTSASSLGLAAQPWYPSFARGLRRVGTDGTAASISDSLRAVFGPPTQLLAKTGTLGVDRSRLFVRSFLFALGTNYPSTPRALDCGVVGMVYFKLRERPAGLATLPDYHVAYFRDEMLRSLRRDWKALSGCAT